MPALTEPTYTDLAVAIGRLEEGQKNVLSGLEDIKGIAKEAVERVGRVELEHAVTKREVADLRVEVAEGKAAAADTKAAAEARRPPWTAIGALLVAGFVGAKQVFGF